MRFPAGHRLGFSTTEPVMCSAVYTRPTNDRITRTITTAPTIYIIFLIKNTGGVVLFCFLKKNKTLINTED
jgi:hypothetical protein